MEKGYVVAADPLLNGGAAVVLNTGDRVTFSASMYKAWLGTELGRPGRYRARPGEIRPMASQTLTGDCGSSTITFVPYGNNNASIATGFVIDEQAIEYEWQVFIADSAGISERYWYGGLAFRTTWSGKADFKGIGGLTDAYVSTGVSYALIYYGALCWSLGPSVSEIVF